MKNRTPLLGALAPLCLGLALATAPGFADTTPAGSSRPTTYAFHATGFGTRLVGGKVPASSRTTAHQTIGCTNQAGRTRSNDVASADIPGLGTVSGVRTHDWTTARHGVVASHATHTIGRISVSSSGLGSLAIDAVKAKVIAFHDATGFHASATTTVGGITFTPPTGPQQTFPAPTPDHPVTIPGLATVYAGKNVRHHSGSAATARATALRIDVVPTGTSLRVAHAAADLASGLTGGIFRGHSAATRVVTAGGGVARSGPNPLSLMPCQGTRGLTRTKALAALDLGDQVVVKGAASSQRGTQRDGAAGGFEKGQVARLSLGGGQLVVTGIVGTVHVRRTPHGVERSARGTELGTVTASGQRQTFPPSGVLDIPGVAKLERKVVTRSGNGIRVIALRVTLLDGSGAVIDLGEAALHVARLPH